MITDKARTISARVTLGEFSKALDGLIAGGIPASKLTSNSSIMRAAILMCCILNENPENPASQESIDTVKQLWKVTKRAKEITLVKELAAAGDRHDWEDCDKIEHKIENNN